MRIGGRNMLKPDDATISSRQPFQLCLLLAFVSFRVLLYNYALLPELNLLPGFFYDFQETAR